MDDRRFDALAKRVGRSSRRSFLGGAAGVLTALVGGRLATRHADAARRGYSGPPTPTPNGHIWVHHGCLDGCGCYSCSYEEGEFVVFDAFIIMDLNSGQCPYATRKECCTWAVEMNTCDMDR